ncbi:MAG TPA: 3-hydroxyacyl-CoA dehydrogenase NAD-binding domain-containing protein, partial [Solirubrobacter sp.]|nr:3-hydroxyacyl-CoA dehydrogenase NAD-binding domain-containing protein [Solirubrobacter sp.]
MFVFTAAVVGEGDAAASVLAALETAGIPLAEGLGSADLVIEAVPDRIEAKHRAFAELDAATPGHAILATTTATLSVSEIAAVTLRPDKVVGLHFAGERVVEVVAGDDTSPETEQAAANVVARLRRAALRCGEAPGYVVGRVAAAAAAERGVGDERLQAAYGPRFAAAHDVAAGDVDERAALRAFVEACLVLEEGVADLRDVELGTGRPFARADARGLDAMLEALERAEDRWGEHFEPPLILRRLVAQGRLGVASGQGFHPYPLVDGGGGPVAVERRGEGGDVAVVWLNHPPANALSPDVIEALWEAW